MTTQGQDVYATLLLSDAYLPGALVLAHSLRDAGTRKKLAVLVTADNISPNVLGELRNLYDYVIPVERVVNPSPSNLYLMDRPDLHSAFTKITLWKQIQFRRIVYMDADMVALRAPDELFNLPQPFSAAPDIGWPDLFNTGLMVLTPNLGDYYALMAMAQRGISFDGADQGLLNMHFKNTYNRLSFSYNVTPSAHYQYVPAYRHFQSSISAAHFIGKEKPWTQGRDVTTGSGPHNELVGRWWAVYDRHYRASTSVISGQGAASIVQHYVKGEYQPPTYGYSSSYGYASPPADTSRDMATGAAEAPMHEVSDHTEQITGEPASGPAQGFTQEESVERGVEKPIEEKKEFTAPFTVWNPAREPPPADSKPEASNFPSTHYEMSSDKTPFKAPEKYPDPPKNMWYDVPKTPTYQKPAPIFPWEKDPPKPTRVFPEDAYDRRMSMESAATDTTEEIAATETTAVGEEKDEPTTPATATVVIPVDPWQAFNLRVNAWDEIPEIERYISALQKNRKGNIQVLQGYGSGVSQTSGPEVRRPSIKLTDFPTEVERPSLPVTPAPVRRPSFWGTERDEDGELPAAEGVPSQEQWDPVAQLEALARRQSEVLASAIGKDESGHEIPTRPLPYGSEGVKSPTYVPPEPPAHGSATTTSPTKTMVDRGTLTEKPVLVERGINTENLLVERGINTENIAEIEKPSFSGPGVMWEKDETYPTKETPLGPSEEEKDVLET